MPAHPASPSAPLDKNRRYPFRLRADAERIAIDAAEIHTCLYMEADFALGTSLGEPWSGHQSDTFFLQYRRSRTTPPNAPLPHSCAVTELHTLYARYLVNEQRPYRTGHGNLLKSHALVHTVHKDRIALVLARPLERLAAQPVHALKFSVIIPTLLAGLDHIEIHPGAPNDESPCAHHVFIKDGPLHIALRGLHATRWNQAPDNPCGIRLEPTPDHDYMLVSFYNYQAAAPGESRQFSAHEISTTLNGFASVIGLASEETWEHFKQRVLSAQLLDYCAFDQRTLTYELGSTRLSASYAMQANRFRYVTIDGRPLPRPIWQADDLPANALPFLADAPAPTPLTSFPYKHMRVIWDPHKSWQINSRQG